MLAADGSAERRSAHCGVDVGTASGNEAGSIWNMNSDHTFNWSSVLRTESSNKCLGEFLTSLLLTAVNFGGNLRNGLEQEDSELCESPWAVDALS